MKAYAILCSLSAIIFSANCINFVYKRESQYNRPATIGFKAPYQSVKYVLLYQTGGSPCSNQSDCTKSVQYIHENSVRKWGQIIFNHLIGGDRYVYEGSGFYEKVNFLGLLKQKCIVIALIGDYTDNEIPELTLTALDELLDFAKQLRYLRKDFILLSSSQVQCNNEGPDIETTLLSSKINFHPNWQNITFKITNKKIELFS